MKRGNIHIVIVVFLLVAGLISCVRQQDPESLIFSSLLVKNQSSVRSNEPGTFAFFSFIQNLSAPSTDSSQILLFEEAKNFFPDSILHPGLSLFGVELTYTDSIRLLYHEFTKAVPPESYAYLTSFSKGGQLIQVLPIKEASFNGNAAVNIIDGATLELEYYDVYDRTGQEEKELTFEYYQIESDGTLKKLTLPEHISEGRDYLEASARLLSIDELKRYEIVELKLLEMELLAEYGQIFTSPKWQSYFRKQYWYNPKTKQAEVLLSDLEKVNLEKIRQVQVSF